jgi:hypothetical protein
MLLKGCGEKSVASALLFIGLFLEASGRVIEWDGVPDVQSAGVDNTQTLIAEINLLRSGDTLQIANRTYWVAGGIYGTGLHNVTIQLDGTLRFLPGRKGWPTQDCAASGNPLQPKKNGTCVKVAHQHARSQSHGR